MTCSVPVFSYMHDIRMIILGKLYISETDNFTRVVLMKTVKIGR